MYLNLQFQSLALMMLNQHKIHSLRGIYHLENFAFIVELTAVEDNVKEKSK